MKGLLDPNFQYIPAAKTNIADTLRRLGFEPPSEDKRYQKKWETFRFLAALNEQGGAK